MRTIRGIGAVTGAALLAACASTPTAETADPAPTETASTDTGAPAEASPAPAPGGQGPAPGSPTDDPVDERLVALSGRQLDGGTFDGAAVTGDVVVWFWAPW